MCRGAQVAELFTKAVATTKCFDQNLRKVKVISCGKGRMLAEFQVGPEQLNQRGTMHGGFVAHLVDAISIYALTANDHIETRGISIDLSVSYMSAAREGDNIQIEATTRKTGKKIAFLEVEVRNKDKNQVLATDSNYLQMLISQARQGVVHQRQVDDVPAVVDTDENRARVVGPNAQMQPCTTANRHPALRDVQPNEMKTPPSQPNYYPTELYL